MTINGHFVNGLANGAWDKTLMSNGGTIPIHQHQEFLNGIPNGEWYEETNGKRSYSHFFKNGKADSLWIDFNSKEKRYDKIETSYRNGFKNGKNVYYKNNSASTSFNYLNGKLDGEFETRSSFIYGESGNFDMVIKGEFKNGVLINELMVYTLDLVTKKMSLTKKIEFNNNIKCSEYHSNGNLKTLIEFEPNDEIKVSMSSIFGEIHLSPKIANCNRLDGMPCDYKKIIFNELGKIESTEYVGSNEYMKQKNK
jgi:hypothetical protein